MPELLLLDDNDDLRWMAKKFLESEGYTVTAVVSTSEANEILKTRSFDIAIFDWDLPDGEGVDVLRRHREQGGTMPVVMITGKGLPQDKVLALKTGADDYLVKPINPHELAARLQAVMRRTQPAERLGADIVGKTVLGKYRVVSIIGAGGMGTVFKVEHTTLGKTFAMKVVQKARDVGDTALKRFQREAQTMSRLSHPSIVSIHDFGVAPSGEPYIIMEYLEGRALSQEITDWGRLPWSRAMPIFDQICDAMEHVHLKRIIHRDLKPANIMIVPDGEKELVKILDLGLAKLSAPGSTDMRLTETGETFGSPLYMSPEQLLGNDLDGRSDVYSVGCLMFETLTGQAPYQAGNYMKIAMLHMNGEIPSVRAACPSSGFSERVDEVIAKALAKQPEQRYQTFEELRAALQSIGTTWAGVSR